MFVVGTLYRFAIDMYFHEPRSQRTTSSVAVPPVMKGSVAAGVWDRIGMWLSGLCAAHCLLMPFLVVALPLWPTVGTVHDWMHPVRAALLVPTTILAMWGAWKARRPHLSLGLLGAGMVIVVFAAVLHEALGRPLEVVVTMAGSGLLIAGHWKNWRMAHRHEGQLHSRHAPIGDVPRSAADPSPHPVSDEAPRSVARADAA